MFRNLEVVVKRTMIGAMAVLMASPVFLGAPLTRVCKATVLVPMPDRLCETLVSWRLVMQGG
jgi:hypothetical protein